MSFTISTPTFQIVDLESFRQYVKVVWFDAYVAYVHDRRIYWTNYIFVTTDSRSNPLKEIMVARTSLDNKLNPDSGYAYMEKVERIIRTGTALASIGVRDTMKGTRIQIELEHRCLKKPEIWESDIEENGLGELRSVDEDSFLGQLIILGPALEHQTQTRRLVRS